MKRRDFLGGILVSATGAADGRTTTNHHAATLKFLADMRRAGVGKVI